MADGQLPPLTKGVSLGQDAWRRLKKSRIAMFCLATIVAIGLLAFFTPLLPLQPPDRKMTQLQYASPQWSAIWRHFDEDAARLSEYSDGDSRAIYRDYPDLGAIGRAMVRWRYRLFGAGSIASICGRDELGRDLLARVFWGARISLLVGLMAGSVALVIGVAYGSIAGYVGGRVDNFMMRFVDVLYSIPFMFVVIFFLTIINDPTLKARLETVGISRMTVFFLLVGAVEWLTMARVVRGQVISLKTEPFVEAARATGANQGRIIGRHIFPNLVSIVIVYLTLTIPRVMLFEAFLSFLGLGVEPPDVSWGLLANDGIRVITPVRVVWWLIFFPSLALGVTLFALNFLGDRLRDALDPKLASR
jgi:oligopeptide transport system permease protein